jgi:hypothetical protein
MLASQIEERARRFVHPHQGAGELELSKTHLGRGDKLPLSYSWFFREVEK